MVYSDQYSSVKVSIFHKIRIKFGKLLAQKFPYLKGRLFGLKLCGFEIGKNVYIGQDLIVASMISEKSCHLAIEDRVAIGPRVSIILSSDANWSGLMQYIAPIRGTVTLKNDCWIGAGVIILPNVTIGQFSIVGAGSVVTQDVEPYTVVTGVPAKFKKKINTNL